jgi:hypothetical protein
VLFLVMAIDESATLHEGLSEPTRALLGVGGSGLLYFAWIIPALVVLFVLALLFFRFILHLEMPYRGIFLLSGSIYIGGAIGVEVLGGSYIEEYGIFNFSYSLIATAEETMEMFGIIIFIYGLLRYNSAHVAAVHVRLFFTGREAPRVGVTRPGAVAHHPGSKA